MEIQTLILLELDSTKSLSALIHASPRLFAVFLSSKEKILSACVMRGIEPEVLPIAIAVAEIYSLPRGPDKTVVMDSIHHLDRLETVENMVQIIPFSTSVHLCRLCRTVDFMISDFVEYIGKKMEGYEFYLGQQRDAYFLSNPLSTTEKGRLQRAFFNLELYSHLFYSEPDEYSKFSANEQAGLFLSRMLSWQIAELACVHAYLLDRLSYIFDEVEDRFVACALEEKAEVTSVNSARFENGCHGQHEDPTSENETGRCSDCDTTGYGSESMSESSSDNEDDDECCSPMACGCPDRFDMEDLFFARHTKISWHNNYMEYMISLGLESLHLLFLMKTEERSQVVVANGQIGGDFLAESLAVDTRNYMVMETRGAEQKDEIPYGQSLKFIGDKLSAPNLAWFWSFGFQQHLATNSTLRSCFFYSWGYVFWDAARIGSSHILDNT
ncbi:hypothetical protein MMC18_001276 [Xylographa bjoerkii]|nr:hypothetical protein [Xylographa bjoerkii]